MRMMRSRFGRKVVCAALEGEVFVNCLLELARGAPAQLMLFVTEEKSVNEVSASRARLAPRFLLRLPEHERLMALMHKQGFQQLAEGVGAPVPRTVRLQSPADLLGRRCAQLSLRVQAERKELRLRRPVQEGLQGRLMPTEVAELYAASIP
ncbi:hypothetical protein LP420_19185 [Massilia sp. B-10]|nr:hypothetical protein LP420_19185 [Massilia sp. B-10]